MEQLSLRKATGDDYEFFYDVKKIVLKHYIEAIWGWDENFQRKFHEENYNVKNTNIIVVDNEDAGTLEIKEDEASIFISSLYILPAYQGKGIGSKLITNFIEQAEKENKRVELEVLKLNVGAQKLYKRLGFTLTERDDTKYFMYKDCS